MKKRRNWHRTRLLRLLDNHGTYYHDRKNYMLEWCLPVYSIKCFDALLLDALVEHAQMPEGVVPVWKAAYKDELKEFEQDIDGNAQWSHHTEMMWDSFKDDDHWCMHPVTNKLYRCEWRLGGRSGKHLLLDRFENYELTGDPAEFLGMFEGPDDTSFSNEDCRALADMIEFWDEHFTRENVTKEYEYQLAWDMYQRFEARGWV